MVLNSYVTIPVVTNDTNVYKYTIRVPIDHPFVSYKHVTEIDVLSNKFATVVCI